VPGGKATLAAFEFDAGTLVLTEAGTKRRASIHLYADRAALQGSDPGGIDVMTCDVATFAQRLTSENHTLKRALTDPRLFSGIGNAYSDEILHRARMSPVTLTRALDAQAIAAIVRRHRAVLAEWTERCCRSRGPRRVAREGHRVPPAMAVHGRYGQPCPVCGSAGAAHRARRQRDELLRALPDRRQAARRPRLSRLLKASWPKHIDDLD
jgi:formamidopyrimidine-DNA glycosylase